MCDITGDAVPRRRATNITVLALLVGAIFSLVGCGDSTVPAPDTSVDEVPLPSSREDAASSDEKPSAMIVEASANPMESWQSMDDPSADGWDSEVLAEQAGEQLDQLGALFLEEGDAATLFADGFISDPLVPSELEVVFEDAVARAERSSAKDAERIGVSGLKHYLASVRAEMVGEPDKKHFKFKMTRVERNEQNTKNVFTTEQFFSLSFPTSESIVEHHATWVVRWLRDGKALKILDIRVPSFERTTTKRAKPLFSDCTESALAANACYREQLVYGMNHWLGRLPVRAMLNRFGTPGVAIGDVNGDGLDDLYLCQEPGLPNRLFLQNDDGTATEVSAAWGVDWIEDSRGAILADFDNDGDQDLAVAIYGNVVIARNEDGKRFEVATALPASGSTASLAAADYDNDGRLDLFVCGYAEDFSGGSIGAADGRFVYHDANNGVANYLYQNLGALNFKDVTAPLGLDQDNRRWSFAASWEDFDNDGDQDLYVANDYGPNNLFRNDGQRFVDVAASFGVEDSASGMSVAWGDYDHDGRMDVYVSNMFSAAGSRITAQDKFKSDTSSAIRGRFRRFARGNSLFRNSSDSFEDVSIDSGVHLGRWAWSSNFVDLNNDSFLDLIVANGYLSSEGDTGDL